MFEALGLSPTSEIVYLALLESPDTDLGHLADHLGMPEARLADALDELARMSLLRRSSTEPGTVRLVDPEDVMARLLAGRREGVTRGHRVIEAGPATFVGQLVEQTELQARLPGAKVERLVGFNAIRERIRTLAESCMREACSFLPGGFQSAASLLFFQGMDTEAADRGIRLRAICLDSVRNDPVTWEYAQRLREVGGEVRTAPALPVRMLIVDRQTAVVPVDVEDGGAVELVISGTGIIAALLALFNAVWEESLPFGTAYGDPDRRLTSQEKQVLVLLAEGHTDEVVARRLGISVRTTRRVVARLLARLGARSRFQAGARAVARKWLEPADLY